MPPRPKPPLRIPDANTIRELQDLHWPGRFRLLHDLNWASGPALHQAREGSAAFAIGGKIWVVGGSRADWSCADIEVYDPTTNVWTAIPTPFSAFEPVFVASPAGKIYSIGGWNWSGACPGVPAAVVEEYDPTTGVLTPKAPMPVPLWHPGVVCMSYGTIYVMGGYPGGHASVNTLQWYNTNTNTWGVMGNPMPTARYDCGCVVGSDGRVYAVGGFDGQAGHDVRVVEAYDPVANTWSTSIAPLNMPRRCFGAVAIGDNIYAIGGLSDCASVNIVEAYDPATNQWSSRSSMPTGRWALAAAVLQDQIYAIGGFQRVGAYQPGNANVSALATVERATLT